MRVNYSPHNWSGIVSMVATCQFGVLFLYFLSLIRCTIYKKGEAAAAAKMSKVSPTTYRFGSLPPKPSIPPKSECAPWAVWILVFIGLGFSGFIFIVNGFFLDTDTPKIKEPFSEIHPESTTQIEMMT